MTNEKKTPDSFKEEKGESMKDSMTESTRNNDNELLPNAEDFTNENGELDAEAFKKSYQEEATVKKDDHGRN